MRKTSLLISMVLLAALLLSACAGEEVQTDVPATDLPPVTEDATATLEAPAAETADPADGTTTPGIPVTGEEDPARLSNQLDYDVWNENGEQIGEVNDMIVDLDNTRISYVIVGTGGFLEIGEKDVLVPWNSLRLATETGDATGGDRAFIYEGDQEAFNNAPDVDLGSLLPAIGEPANGWDDEIRAFWESGVLPATAVPDATAAPDATSAPEATAATGTVELQGVILASDLLGAGISSAPAHDDAGAPAADQMTATPEAGSDAATPTVDPAAGPDPAFGQFTGSVDDAIVDTESGEILYLVISAGLEDGERWIPIPLSFFQWDAATGTLVLTVDPVVLGDAPFFADGLYPDTTAEGWNSEFDAYWQNQ